MGIGGISIWQLLIILVIVMLIFGTKRLKSLGGDLGGAIKSFRGAMDAENAKEQTGGDETEDQRKIEAESAPDAQFAEQKEQQRHG
ncbi:Sec-independent protein translocase subunit TatA [Candidatus Rariloculus sp.]|uniref:Sec-independent protein translocase subunit TatA n=1 Tax=Candidatus Rariloculus sp. TaxID=3101265 RepID=UPI003D0CE73B